MSAWTEVERARHPQRPYALDYIDAIFRGFIELHGDRLFGDDQALIGGPASLDDTTVMLIAHQKGRTTAERFARNFGMANPEGYRKALRLLRQAEKFEFPVVTLIDTPGAFPGAEAEERGIAWAIAQDLLAFVQARVPVLNVVIGEGGSGGALGIGLGDRLLMLEHSIYTVASPESCAAILWRDAERKHEAAEALKLTANDLLRLGVVDEVIPEPAGGADQDYGLAADHLGEALRRHLQVLLATDLDELLLARHRRYRWLRPDRLPAPEAEPPLLPKARRKAAPSEDAGGAGLQDTGEVPATPADGYAA